jgi:hypothetical protein
LDSDEIVLFLARPRLQKQAEFGEKIRELRRICDELLGVHEPEAAAKVLGERARKRLLRARSAKSRTSEKRNGRCAI